MAVEGQLASPRRGPVCGEIDPGRADRFCILGAGSSGLAVAKSFQQRGLAFDCLERADDIGGNWNYGQSTSSVYRSTRLISSKRLTEYTDFPMPARYPEHPDQAMVGRYLRSYAQHFGLYEQIEFGAGVRWLEPAHGGGWVATLDSGQRRRYHGVVIANGHNWDPRWPVLPGRFTGEVLHSSQYKTPEVLAGRRVLVVGGGNSGYDLASESAQHAAATFHSLRRHYSLLPRYFRGRPVDQCGEWLLRWRAPLWLRRLSAARVCRLASDAAGTRDALRPDHPFFVTHPAINSRWPHDVARGTVALRPDLCELDGRGVRFADGSRDDVDVIVFATGYRLSFPFLSRQRLNWHDNRPNLFLNIFHPERDDLFVAGLIQPDSGQFGLVDCQAQLIAAYVGGLATRHKAAIRFRAAKRHPARGARQRIRYADTPRHLVEVEHFSYRRTLERFIRRFEPH